MAADGRDLLEPEPRRGLLTRVIIALAVVAGGVVAWQALSWRALPDPESGASGSSITLRHVRDFGELDGPGAIGRPVAVAEDRRGRLYVVSEESSYRIVVFDSMGSHLRTLGVEGAGPGEFRSIVALQIGRGDILRVFDDRNARITVLDPEGQLAGTIPFVGYVTATAELADGQIVVAGLIGQDTSSAPLHLIDRSGAVTASFGEPYAQRDHRTFYASRRVVASAADGSIWAATPLTYRIERWSSGKLDRIVERDDEWFPARSIPGPVTPERPPDPEIRAIQEGRDGLLRILVTVGEPQWAEGLGDRASRTPEGDYHPIEDVDRVFGTRIEVIDPASSSVVAEMETEEWLFAFLRSDLAVSYRESPFPRLSVWELVLHGDGDDEADRASAEVDSGGIRIVATDGGTARASTGWRVDSIAELQIGRADGDAAYLFARIRGIATVSGARIVILGGGG